MGSKITGKTVIVNPTVYTEKKDPGYPLSTKKLKDYEEVCDKCNGLGLTKYRSDEFNPMSSSYRCPKCSGFGKLDFIEKIVGKKLKYNQDDLRLFTNSVGTLNIDTSGNVGIGIQGPSQTLEIK